MRMQFLASLINDRKLTIGYELGVESGDTFGYILGNCPSITQWHGVDTVSYTHLRAHET